MRRLRLQIDRIGPHFRTVLVHGEMGTGKELVARALLARSRYAASSFSHCHGAALAATIDDKQRGIADSPGRRYEQAYPVRFSWMASMRCLLQRRADSLKSWQSNCGFESMMMVATAVKPTKHGRSRTLPF